jgi:hypothetical protein
MLHYTVLDACLTSAKYHSNRDNNATGRIDYIAPTAKEMNSEQ